MDLSSAVGSKSDDLLVFVAEYCLEVVVHALGLCLRLRCHVAITITGHVSLPLLPKHLHTAVLLR